MAQEKPQEVEDLIRLNDLNEGSLLWTLRTRYDGDKIYVGVLSSLVDVTDIHWTDDCINQPVQEVTTVWHRDFGQVQRRCRGATPTSVCCCKQGMSHM